jgi:hypothetical protein
LLDLLYSSTLKTDTKWWWTPHYTASHLRREYSSLLQQLRISTETSWYLPNLLKCPVPHPLLEYNRILYVSTSISVCLDCQHLLVWIICLTQVAQVLKPFPHIFIPLQTDRRGLTKMIIHDISSGTWRSTAW